MYVVNQIFRLIIDPIDPFDDRPNEIKLIKMLCNIFQRLPDIKLPEIGRWAVQIPR